MYVCIVCMYVYICIYIMYKKDLRKTTCRNIIGILKNSSFCFFHLINQHIYIYIYMSVCLCFVYMMFCAIWFQNENSHLS